MIMIHDENVDPDSLEIYAPDDVDRVDVPIYSGRAGFVAESLVDGIYTGIMRDSWDGESVRVTVDVFGVNADITSDR